MRDRPYDEVMIEHFQKDPAYAAGLLNSIFEDGDDQGELGVLLPLMAAALSTQPPPSPDGAVVLTEFDHHSPGNGPPPVSGAAFPRRTHHA